MPQYRILALAIPSFLHAACADCTTASDCASGELCRLGDCVPPPVGMVPSGGPRTDAGVSARPDAGAVVRDAGPASGWVTDDRLWPRVATGTTAHLNAVWGTADDDVWAVGSRGTILHFDGTSWQSVPSGTDVALFDVTGVGRDAVFIAGDRGTLLAYDGSVWSRVATPPTNEPYRALDARTPDDVWIVGPRGVAVHYDGTTASEVALGIDELMLDVTIAGANDVWAVGPYTTAVRWDGRAWSVVTRSAGAGWTLRRVQAAGGEVYAVAGEGHVGPWNGTEFFTLQQGFAVADFWLNDDGTYWIANAFGYVMHLGDTVQVQHTGFRLDAHVEAMVVLPSGTMWLVGGAGLALKGPGTIPKNTPDPLFGPGRLGLAGTDFTAQPIVPLQVAATGVSTCVRLSDGTVECFGGVLGPDGVPTPIAGFDAAIDLAMSDSGVCILRDDHRTLCYDSYAGTITPRSIPYDYDRLFSGRNKMCGRIPSAGSIDCFGPGAEGGGEGVRGGLHDVTAYSGDPDGFVAVLADGTLRSGGTSYAMKYGVGPNIGPTLLAPMQPPEPVGATAASIDFLHACAVARGHVWCWGGNRDGEVGDGTMETRWFAVRVEGIDDAVDVAVARGTSCAVRASGGVECWGSNLAGALGDGTAPMGRPVPGAVSRIDDAVQIAAGEAHVCTLRRTGVVSCWGYGESGQLGDGTTSSRGEPVDVVF